MTVKLNDKQYDFLKEHLSVDRPELLKFFDNKSNLIFVIDEDIANDVRDWAGEKLQKEGFDINYNLNKKGIILEQLEDLFYS